MGEDDLLSLNFSAIRKPALGDRSKCEFDRNVRAHNLVINHKEIMVILRRLNRLVACVFQRVFKQKFGLSLHQPDGLAVDIRVSFLRLQPLGKVDPVLVFVYSPLSRIDDLVGLERMISRLVGFANGANADADKCPAGLGLVIP
jgi:hypothetical protein